MQPFAHRHTHLRVERAHAELKPGAGRNDVIGITGVDGADGDHRRLQRVHMARHQGLQRHHGRRGGHHHIGGLVGHGAVPAMTVQGHRHIVGRRQCGAAAEHQLPLWEAGHVVHGKNGVAGEALEQPVVHHLECAAAAFLGRLEDQVERAAPSAGVRQQLGRRQQHGGVAVMAAGVHQARALAGPGGAGGFGDRQRVHVGAQANAGGALATHQLADHPGATQAGRHRIAPAAQLVGHQRAGAVLLKRQFGVLVDVAPKGDEGLQGGVA